MSRPWHVPELWPNSTVYIIGGGPSLKEEDLTPLHNSARRVIGVNNAYQLGSWIDLCFFGDCSWFNHHRKGLLKFAGLKVSCCPRFGGRNEKWPGIKFLPKDKEKRNGISNRKNRNKIAWNKNSGYSAINLAYYLGAKRIVLLGFDMHRGPNNETHWHAGHKWGVPKDTKQRRKLNEPYARFLPNTEAIAKDAERLGIEIINCSMDSAITQFKKIPLKEIVQTDSHELLVSKSGNELVVLKEEEVASTSISIAMTSYNSAKFITEALDSILMQSHAKWELIIVDDCSADNTLDVLEKYITEHNIKEKVIVIKHDENQGYGASLGKAIASTSNDLVVILDSDDCLFTGNVFQTCIRVHLAHPEASMTYSNYMVCDKNMHHRSNMNTKQIGKGETWLYKEGNELKTGLKISHLKTIKRTFYDKTEGIEPTLRKMVDKDLILKLSEVGSLVHIDKILMKYRRHKNSLTSTFRHLSKEEQGKLRRDRDQIYEKAIERRRAQNGETLRVYVDGSKRNAVSLMFPYWERNGVVLVDNLKEADVQFSVVRKNVESNIPTLLRIDGVYYDKECRDDRNIAIGHSHSIADALVYQSDCSRQMCEKCLPKRKSGCCWQIIYNGVDASKWRSPLEHQGINVISCSKWRRVKRLPEMIEIFKRFRTIYPEAVFHVIGPMGKGAKEILCDNVIYYGHLAHSEIQKMYQTGDVSLHLCKKDSCPSNVPESIAAGIPVVTTNLCGGAAEMSKLAEGCSIVYEGEQCFDADYIYQDEYNKMTDVVQEKCVQAMINIVKNKMRVELPVELTIEYVARKYLTMMRGICDGSS